MQLHVRRSRTERMLRSLSQFFVTQFGTSLWGVTRVTCQCNHIELCCSRLLQPPTLLLPPSPMSPLPLLPSHTHTHHNQQVLATGRSFEYTHGMMEVCLCVCVGQKSLSLPFFSWLSAAADQEAVISLCMWQHKITCMLACRDQPHVCDTLPAFADSHTHVTTAVPSSPQLTPAPFPIPHSTPSPNVLAQQYVLDWYSYEGQDAVQVSHCPYSAYCYTPYTYNIALAASGGSSYDSYGDKNDYEPKYEGHKEHDYKYYDHHAQRKH